MVLTNHAFSETLGKEKVKEDKLAAMEKQFIKMQSQIRDLILAVIKTKHELDFETLRDHNIPTKEAATATTPATDYLSLEKGDAEEEREEGQSSCTIYRSTTGINAGIHQEHQKQEQEQHQQKKQKRIQKQLIKAAGRAAFYATTRKRKRSSGE